MSDRLEKIEQRLARVMDRDDLNPLERVLDGHALSTQDVPWLISEIRRLRLQIAAKDKVLAILGVEVEAKEHPLEPEEGPEEKNHD